MKRKIITLSLLLLASSSLFAQFWNDNGNFATGAEWLGTQNNQPLNFRTNNIQRITITAAGDVGVGIAAPAQKFVVSGNYPETIIINEQKT